MTHRIELKIKPHLMDPAGNQYLKESHLCGFSKIQKIRTLQIYMFSGQDWGSLQDLCHDVFQDSVLHDSQVDQFFGNESHFDWYVEIGFLPGVTDNVGRSAKETCELYLQHAIKGKVYSRRAYLVQGHLDDTQKWVDTILRNPLIESAWIIPKKEWQARHVELMKLPIMQEHAQIEVQRFQLKTTDEALKISQDNTLALNEEEAQVIVNYFADTQRHQARLHNGIGIDATDAELELLAQTWSEHCKHKIFNAQIEYEDQEQQTTTIIHSLYETYIKQATKDVQKLKGNQDFCVSVFSDNAGLIEFNNDWLLAFKVETHNSPSALDPYGGALTGIVGVHRDIIGAGLGCRVIFNTDVFCFADPFYEGALPPKLLHPRRIFSGVRLGVEHGGNKSGVPTVNGSLVFHERFLGKPLVFCGAGGMIPRTINNRLSTTKKVQVDDCIVMCGGRIGKDGIHGATFSSEVLHEGSPSTAVQIGDPIVQKRMSDFLMKARDLELYRCITDNGAGGLASSVGEMAQLSGGCLIDLAKAPLKYAGLQPWEILVSEAQERMTLAVPPENCDALLELSKMMGVESTILGTFNDSGYFHAVYGDQPVAFLEMEFLHHGLPTLKLHASWQTPILPDATFPKPDNLTEELKQVLARLNVCSKESIVRQYDHEVQGGSVIKPFVGVESDSPSDATVLRPLLDSMEAVAISHGICPRYSDIDTYAMTACAIDEAVRNLVAVGASLENIAALDNFCWCDPVESPSNPDGAYKLAQLVRSNQALYDYCVLYEIPLISGKDSMKNDYHFEDIKISIPPTLLVSAVAKIQDASKVVTMDAKQAGDLIYLLGETFDELGGSEYFDLHQELGKHAPQVDGKSAKKRYQTIYDAIQKGFLQSCHDCSDGGVAVALAETAFAGNLGMDLNIETPCQSLRMDHFLFSESQSRFVVTISPHQQQHFENLFTEQPCFYLGKTTQNPFFQIKYANDEVISSPIQNLKQAWQSTLKEM